MVKKNMVKKKIGFEVISEGIRVTYTPLNCTAHRWNQG